MKELQVLRITNFLKLSSEHAASIVTISAKFALCLLSSFLKDSIRNKMNLEVAGVDDQIPLI